MFFRTLLLLILSVPSYGFVSKHTIDVSSGPLTVAQAIKQQASGALLTIDQHYQNKKYQLCINEIQRSGKSYPTLSFWLILKELDCLSGLARGKTWTMGVGDLQRLSASIKDHFLDIQASRLESRWLRFLTLLLSKESYTKNKRTQWLSTIEFWKSRFNKEQLSDYYYILGVASEESGNKEAAAHYYGLSWNEGEKTLAYSKLKKLGAEPFDLYKANTKINNGFSPEEVALYNGWSTDLKRGRFDSAFKKAITYLKKYTYSVRAPTVADKTSRGYTRLAVKSTDKFQSGERRYLTYLIQFPAQYLHSSCKRVFWRGRYVKAAKVCSAAAKDAKDFESAIFAGKAYMYVNNFKKAEYEFSRLRELAGGTEKYSEASFYLAVTYLKQRKWKSALNTLDPLILAPNIGDYQYRIRFWHLRTLKKLGRTTYRSFAREFIKRYPFTYYGLVVRQSLEGSLKSLLLGKERKTVTFWWTPIMQDTWKRISKLIEVGWWKEAKEELNDFPPVHSGEEYVAKASLWMRTLNTIKAIPLVNLGMERDPSIKSKESLVFGFPVWYQSEIKAAAKKMQLNDKFIMGLIRQESSFNADAVSRAGARGLMQVIPATAKQSMRSLRLKQKNVNLALATPSSNVQIGSHYIKRMIKKYKNHIPLSLAAYNAGPGRTDRWLAARGKSPENSGEKGFEELWMDELPWGETSFYVKAVLRNYILYSYLEGGLVSLPTPPWKGVLGAGS